MAFDKNLFIRRDVLSRRPVFTKEAATKIGNDSSRWEQEIVSAFHEQHPFLKDAQVRTHIHRSDPESGTLVGQIVVDEKAAVPIIVDRHKIQPFDLFLIEGKLRPLTKEAFLDIVQPTSVGTVAPPGTGETADVSIFNMVQPPFAGKYSFADSLVFTLDEYEKALTELGPQGLEYALKTNSVFAKTAGAYACSALEKRAGTEAKPTYRAEKITLAPFMPVEKSGTYEVLSGGISKIAGVVADKVIDLRYNKVDDDKLFCSFDGKVALAENMGGRPVSAPDTEFGSDALSPGLGFFWLAKNGSFVVTRPVHLRRIGHDPDPIIKIADLSGSEMTVRPSSDLDGLLVSGSDVFMGNDWRWKACSGIVKVADAVTANAAAWPDCAEIRNLHGNWSTHGLSFPDIAADSETTENLFMKLSSRFGHETTLDLMKTAEDEGRVFFSCVAEAKDVPRALPSGIFPVSLIHAALAVQPVEITGFDKIAVTIKPEEVEDTVDTLLGLNFLTPENIETFVEHSEKLEDATSLLSKLLLASRMGLKIDAAPLRTALFALDNITRQIQHLRSVASSEE